MVYCEAGVSLETAKNVAGERLVLAKIINRYRKSLSACQTRKLMAATLVETEIIKLIESEISLMDFDLRLKALTRPLAQSETEAAEIALAKRSFTKATASWLLIPN